MSTFTLRRTLAEIEAKERIEQAKLEIEAKERAEQTKLEIEVKERIEQAKTELVCEICGKVYKTQKGLDSHIATKHKECDSIDTR